MRLLLRCAAFHFLWTQTLSRRRGFCLTFIQRCKFVGISYPRRYHRVRSIVHDSTSAAVRYCTSQIITETSQPGLLRSPSSPSDSDCVQQIGCNVFHGEHIISTGELHRSRPAVHSHRDPRRRLIRSRDPHSAKKRATCVATTLHSGSGDQPPLKHKTINAVRTSRQRQNTKSSDLELSTTEMCQS